MAKRKAEDFFQCAGIKGVPDCAIRKVLAKLRGEDSRRAASQKPAFELRFQHLKGALLQDEATGIFTCNLQVYLDKLCEHHHLVELLREHVLPARQADGSLSGCIYADEAVPGNVLRPGNKRKAWLFYFSWLPLVKFRNEFWWFPLAVVRSERILELEGGLPRVLHTVLQQSLQFLHGLVIGEDLVVTKRLYLLGDEDALKKLSPGKGASGLRPCLRCNAVSRGRGVAGLPGIEEEDLACFTLSQDNDVLAMLRHLQFLHENASRSRLEDAEKLSGRKYSPYSVFLDPELKELLQPGMLQYDVMHKLWNNGIIGMELGLFWHRAAALGAARKDLEEFAGLRWSRTMCIGTSSGNFKLLVSPKLLKDGGNDYAGDADQTIELMTLLNFYADQTRSAAYPALGPCIASLQALCRVHVHVLNAKLHPAQVEGLAELQKQHLRLFKEVYGDVARPKHHYALHTELQVQEAGLLMDTWPCERKHRTFKSELAPRLKRLDKFERSAHMRWLEQDLERLATTETQSSLLKPIKVQQIQDMRFSKALRFRPGQEFAAGNVLLFKEGTWQACVVACFHESADGQIGCIAQSLTLLDYEKASCLWSRWQLTPGFVALPAQQLLSALRTSFYAWDAGETLILLR